MRWLGLCAVALIVTTSLGVMTFYQQREASVRNLSYGELMRLLQTKDSSVRFRNVLVAKNDVRGEIVVTDQVLRQGDGVKTVSEVRPFRARIGLPLDRDLLQLLDQRAGAEYRGEEDETFARGVTSMMSLLIFGAVIVIGGFFLIRWLSGGSSPFSFGRSRHRLYEDAAHRTTFANVAGIDEAVAELREIVDFLKNPEKYQALGGRIPKGVLLVGPPGTGKTLLARAVAGEAEVPFFNLSGSDFVEMFVGVGASRVRDLFQQAESRAPCIIFIDELDALGKTRGSNPIGGHEEREQTLNQLLVEMDGFDANSGVILMGATNRPETLDPALLRAGRFDRTVVVDRPDVKGREAILKVHSRNVKLGDDADLRKIASLTPGSVGADLENLINEGALLAARNGKSSVGMAELNEAIERGAIGLERKSRIIKAEEKRRLAYHEAGHALIACSLPFADPVHKVTIIPRGPGALGYVLQRPEDDRHMHTRGELLTRIKVCLGGTLAEEITFDEIANGATSDLQRANMIARRMVKEFGMSRLGRIFFRDEGESTFLAGSGGSGDRASETTSREIEMEVRSILDDASREVRELLVTRRESLDALAETLFEKEVISGEELHQLLAVCKAPTTEEPIRVDPLRNGH
jgi:cell division protease FtsH